MYSEWAVQGLGVVWRVEPPTPHEHSEPASTIVPADGCADFVLRGDALLIAGPSTTWLRSPVELAGPTVGMRFAPGTAATAFQRPLRALRDELVLAEDAVERAAAHRTAGVLRALAAGTVSAARHLMHDRTYIETLMTSIDTEGDAGGSPPLWTRTVIRAADREEAFGPLARRLGRSERQLHRSMISEFGYGYAALRRVRRGQRARARLQAGDTLAEVAVEAGYSDQAHFTREFSRLTGESPSRYARSIQAVAESSAGAVGSGA
ncbi:helix-turn-helix transcriptional regulator [Leucobacter alluvii]|uniref:Helix-turn-helix transcriptional regulator n=1 Tax=Leucobacter alluvii TaxID=340321 RepID=A0ABP5MWS8_9MICO|nr:AraC family transcriptional regulator [Leucobacter sp. L43]